MQGGPQNQALQEKYKSTLHTMLCYVYIKIYKDVKR